MKRDDAPDERSARGKKTSLVRSNAHDLCSSSRGYLLFFHCKVDPGGFVCVDLFHISSLHARLSVAFRVPDARRERENTKTQFELMKEDLIVKFAFLFESTDTI